MDFEAIPYIKAIYLESTSTWKDSLCLQKMFFNNINFQEIKDNLISIASNYDDGYMRVIIGRGSDKDKSDVYIFYQGKLPESFTLQFIWRTGMLEVILI